MDTTSQIDTTTQPDTTHMATTQLDTTTQMDTTQTTGSGTVQSENYPLPYPEDQDYTWTIQVDPGLLATVSFTDFDTD